VGAPGADEPDAVLRAVRLDPGDGDAVGPLHQQAAAVGLEAVRPEDVEPVALVVAVPGGAEPLPPRPAEVGPAHPVAAAALHPDAVAVPRDPPAGDDDAVHPATHHPGAD